MLFVFVFTNTEIHQVFKMPALIQHFSDHQQEDSYKTIFDFIVEHYSNAQHHATTEGHGKLPFKNNDCGKIHGTVIFISVVLHFKASPQMNQDKIYTLYKSINHTSFSLNNIWQPPKA